MIICSCNVISTKDIKDYVRCNVSPSVKDALSFLGWQNGCATCLTSLIEEIKTEINNKSFEQ